MADKQSRNFETLRKNIVEGEKIKNPRVRNALYTLVARAIKDYYKEGDEATKDYFKKNVLDEYKTTSKKANRFIRVNKFKDAIKEMDLSDYDLLSIASALYTEDELGSLSVTPKGVFITDKKGDKVTFGGKNSPLFRLDAFRELVTRNATIVDKLPKDQKTNTLSELIRYITSVPPKDFDKRALSGVEKFKLRDELELVEYEKELDAKYADKPKTEESKPEEPKTEESKPEEPKTEESKPEEPKTEESKPEEPKPEVPKPDKPSTEDMRKAMINRLVERGYKRDEIKDFDNEKIASMYSDLFDPRFQKYGRPPPVPPQASADRDLVRQNIIRIQNLLQKQYGKGYDNLSQEQRQRIAFALHNAGLGRGQEIPVSQVDNIVEQVSGLKIADIKASEGLLQKGAKILEGIGVKSKGEDVTDPTEETIAENVADKLHPKPPVPPVPPTTGVTTTPVQMPTKFTTVEEDRSKYREEWATNKENKGTQRPKFISPSVNILQPSEQQQQADFDEWAIFDFVQPVNNLGAEGNLANNPLKRMARVEEETRFRNAGIELNPALSSVFTDRAIDTKQEQLAPDTSKAPRQVYDISEYEVKSYDVTNDRTAIEYQSPYDNMTPVVLTNDEIRRSVLYGRCP
jgi:hypothetical protein